jgi:molybdate transport system ATP-binding protein
MTLAAHDAGFGMTRLHSAAGEIHVPGFIGPPGTPARVRIRARDVMLATEEPRNISALNILRGTVSAVGDAGPSAVNVTLDCASSAVVARITRQSAAALGIREGLAAYAVVKAVSVSGPTPGAR